MKQSFKIIILILVFILPIGVFVFLKLFGRNEFGVAPLFVKEAPPQTDGCDFKSVLPYVVPDSVQRHYQLSADSLTVIFFGPLSGEGQNQLDRIKELTTTDPVQIFEAITYKPDNSVTSRDTTIDTPGTSAGSVNTQERSIMDQESLRRCVFFLDSVKDVVMLDHRGAIRGQYTAADRDEMDRMLTEITIILKKY
ncbi:MAG: hypothetical protein QM762_24635 [Chryseolinea sp.]